MAKGYTGVDGRGHRLVVEAVLGRALPVRHPVHHVDENPGNNRNDNLVLCEDHAYHRLLHKRTDALRATGNPSSRRCYICKQWDEPARMVNYPLVQPARGTFVDRYYHRECRRTYQSVARQKRARTSRLAASSSGLTENQDESSIG